MTEAEREALELLNEEQAASFAPYEWGVRDTEYPPVRALIRAIEERNALRADMAEIDRIADECGPYEAQQSGCDRLEMIARIAAKHRAEPDPLVEAVEALADATGINIPHHRSGTGRTAEMVPVFCKDLRAELAKRGIELARKEQPNG